MIPLGRENLFLMLIVLLLVEEFIMNIMGTWGVETTAI